VTAAASFEALALVIPAVARELACRGTRRPPPAAAHTRPSRARTCNGASRPNLRLSNGHAAQPAAPLHGPKPRCAGVCANEELQLRASARGAVGCSGLLDSATLKQAVSMRPRGACGGHATTYGRFRDLSALTAAASSAALALVIPALARKPAFRGTRRPPPAAAHTRPSPARTCDGAECSTLRLSNGHQAKLRG